MTDLQIIEHLRNSIDPDDHALVVRWDRLAEYRTRRDLSAQQAAVVKQLARTVERELAFLRRPTRYRISHPRPCLPLWHDTLFL